MRPWSLSWSWYRPEPPLLMSPRIDFPEEQAIATGFVAQDGRMVPYHTYDYDPRSGRSWVSIYVPVPWPSALHDDAPLCAMVGRPGDRTSRKFMVTWREFCAQYNYYAAGQGDIGMFLRMTYGG